MKTLKNFTVCISAIILSFSSMPCFPQFTYELEENLIIPDEDIGGVIPEDMLIADNKIFIYGTHRILILDETDYSHINSIDISDLGNNSFDGFSYTSNNKSHSMMAYNEDHKLFVITPEYEIAVINTTGSCSIEPYRIPKPSLYVGSYFARSIIKYDPSTNRIFWSLHTDVPNEKSFLCVYEGESPYNNVFIQEFISDGINDIAINSIENVYYLARKDRIEVGWTTDVQFVARKTVTTNGTVYRILYVNNTNNGLHKVYFLPRNNYILFPKIYIIDGNDYNFPVENFDAPFNMVYSGAYDPVRNRLYFGTESINQGDVFIYDADDPNNGPIEEISTGNIYPEYLSLVIPYHLEYYNDKVYAYKASLLVAINCETYSTFPVLSGLHNYYFGGAINQNLGQLLILNLAGGTVEVIDDSGNYLQSIITGITLNGGCYNFINNKAYFISDDIRQNSKLAIYDKDENLVSIKEFIYPTSSCIYNPYFNHILVSFYLDPYYIKVIDGASTNNAFLADIQLLGNYCAGIFIANNKLYCVTGGNLGGNANVLIYNLSDFSYSYNASIPISTGSQIISDLVVDFCFNKGNDKLYIALSDSPDGTYAKIIEIESDNSYQFISLTEGPISLECSYLSNKIYIQHFGKNYLSAFLCDAPNNVYQIPFQSNEIVDIEYDKHRDVLYAAGSDAIVWPLFCETDYIAEDTTRRFNLEEDITSLRYNTKNRMLYAYSARRTTDNQALFWIMNPRYPWITENLYLENTEVFRIANPVKYTNVVLDFHNNYLYIPNGSHSNIGILKCEPEKLYIDNFNYYNWISFPSLERPWNQDIGVPPIPVLENLTPWPDYLHMDGVEPGLSETQYIEYISGDWDPYSTLNSIFSSRGYILDNDLQTIMQSYIPLPGWKLDPQNTIHLYAGEDIENWVGYYIDETQDAFEALSDILDDLTSIKAETWACAKFYSEGSLVPYWLCMGPDKLRNLRYGEGIILISTNETDFQWPNSYDPYPYQERPLVENYTFEENSNYTPIFIELDTNDLPIEIGAFINDTCIGASSVLEEDTIIMIQAYSEIDSAGPVEFEQYYGGYKSSFEERIRDYYSYDHKLLKKIKKAIYLTNKQGAQLVSFKAKGNLPDQDFDNHIRIFPNPSNSQVKIIFNIEQDSYITIEIFNITGQKTITLDKGKKAKGIHEIVWNINNDGGNKVPNGIYLLNFKSDFFNLIQKIIVVD